MAVVATVACYARTAKVNGRADVTPDGKAARRPPDGPPLPVQASHQGGDAAVCHTAPDVPAPPRIRCHGLRRYNHDRLAAGARRPCCRAGLIQRQRVLAVLLVVPGRALIGAVR